MTTAERNQRPVAVRARAEMPSLDGGWPKGLAVVGCAWTLLGLCGFAFPLSPHYVLALGLVTVAVAVATFYLKGASRVTTPRPAVAVRKRFRSVPNRALQTSPVVVSKPEAKVNWGPSSAQVELVAVKKLELLRPELVALSLRATLLAGQIEAAKLDLADASERAVAASGDTGQLGTQLHSLEQMARRLEMVALNAAIEAARAKEHGLGFAIVANEVRTIAGKFRSQVATTLKTVEFAGARGERSGWVENALGATSEGIGELQRQLTNVVANLNDGGSTSAASVTPASPRPKVREALPRKAGGRIVLLGAAPQISTPNLAPKPVSRALVKGGKNSFAVGGRATKPVFRLPKTAPPALASIDLGEKEKVEPPEPVPASGEGKHLEGGHDAEDARFERF